MTAPKTLTTCPILVRPFLETFSLQQTNPLWTTSQTATDNPLTSTISI